MCEINLMHCHVVRDVLEVAIMTGYAEQAAIEVKIWRTYYKIALGPTVSG